MPLGLGRMNTRYPLADLFSCDIKEVLLDGAVGTDAHHNDTSTFILNTLNENPIQHDMAKVLSFEKTKKLVFSCFFAHLFVSLRLLY